MVALYVTSPEKGSGKTAICAGLGMRLLNDRKKVGFLKPVIAGEADRADSDATFIQQLFTLDEPVNLLCPAFRDESNLRNGIKEAYARVSSGKDVVIIEGISAQSPASRHIVEALDAKVIIVESYSPELLPANYPEFGQHLLGIVFNKVPRSRMERVRSAAATPSANAGIKSLGVLPEDRTLFTLTIGELAQHIQGEILVGAAKSANMVENFMLGAMCIDPGPVYFGHKTNKAAIIRSERSDMQLAALETSTRCLVLTGTVAPQAVVLQLAEEKNIPVILARDELTAIVTKIEDTLGKTRFNQAKLSRLTEIIEPNFDFKTVYQGLGFASS